MSGFDHDRFKANERAGFNRIATRYQAGARLRQSLQDALVEFAAPARNECVLDLASGPCLLAADAAARVGPSGLVVASDIAEAMLAAGREALPAEQARRMVFAACDAEHLPFAGSCFDLVLMGLGLFILPSAERALAEIRRVLRPGGRLVLSVWGARDEVPLIRHAQDCIARLLPAPKLPRPSVFRFGEPGVLETTLRDAGFGDIALLDHQLSCQFASATDYWQAFLDLAGGAAESIGRLPAEVQQRLSDEIAQDLATCRREPDIVTDSLVLLARARK